MSGTYSSNTTTATIKQPNSPHTKNECVCVCVFHKWKKWVTFIKYGKNRRNANTEKASWTIVKRTTNCCCLFSSVFYFCFVALYRFMDFDWSATKCNEFEWQFKKQSHFFSLLRRAKPSIEKLHTHIIYICFTI